MTAVTSVAARASRRETNKNSIHFRDDLSEYSSPSSWGDGPGPLSLLDHRLAVDGLQARRTVGEALVLAERERKYQEEREAGGDSCNRCLGIKVAAPRLGLSVFRRSAAPKPSVVFTYAEVQSLILLPYEEKGPYLIAVTAQRLREDGSREWLLQAGSLRARTRWAVEMTAALLRDRLTSTDAHSRVKCVHSGRTSRVPNVLFMDLVRIACEAARLRPSAECMARLIEAVELLMEVGQPTQALAGDGPPPAIVHFPMAALQRFRDMTERAREDFFSWQRWREVALLVRCPPGWDEHLWRDRVLPFLAPLEPSLRNTSTSDYPAAVDQQLASAADRCRRTLS